MVAAIQKHKQAALAAALVTGMGMVAAYALLHHSSPAPRLAYDPSGYGGYVAAPAPKKSPAPLKPAAPDLVQTAASAYNAGHYAEAEAVSLQAAHAAANSPVLKEREEGAQARLLLAYSAARRNDLVLARERFADLKTAASKLPTRGPSRSSPARQD